MLAEIINPLMMMMIRGRGEVTSNMMVYDLGRGVKNDWKNVDVTCEWLLISNPLTMDES